MSNKTPLSNTDTNQSYFELYNSLLSTFRNTQSAGCLVQYSVINYMLVSLLVSPVLAILTAIKIETFFYGFNFLLASTIGYWYFAFLIITVLISKQDVLEDVPTLTARLIYNIPKPYSDDKGLNYESIQNLKRIAEADQNSSEWRANFINFVVIGLIVYLLGFADSTYSWFSENIGTVIQVITSKGQTINQDLRTFASISYFSMFFWLLICILFARLSQKLFLFLYQYTRAEGINRLIIFACNETLILFEKANLVSSESLSIEQKQTLLEKLHFRLVNKNELKDAGLRSKYIETTEQEWFLLSDQHYSELLERLSSRNKQRERVSKVFNYLRKGKEFVVVMWRRLTGRLPKKTKRQKAKKA